VVLRAILAASLTVVLQSAPASAAIPITECGTLISAPGDYFLATDLQDCTFGIEVMASNVRLRLMSRTIRGTVDL
jgi:hypothetical protein